MAITNALNAPRNSYTSTAAQTAFTVGFEFYQVSDVKVYKNGSLMTYNAAPSNTVTYSITGTASAGDSAYEFGGGGSVVFGSGLTDGDIVVIVRDIAVERTVDFNPSSAFDITTLNTQLDTIIGMIADREKQGDRSVKLLDTDIVAATVTLPLKATRASKVLSFDADGNTETTITSTGLSTISSITADIVTVAGISSDISAVENIAANVTTVAGISADVTSVAGVSADVTTVAGIASDVSAVENIAANVTTVAGISSNVTTVAGANANISTVVGGLTNINTVAGAVANVNTVASNLAGVNSFAERYRVTGGDPGSDNDAGDLNYNTSSNALKYWDGSSWNTIASSYSIDTASDTNLTSTADGAMLLYDTGTSKWIDNVMSGDATMANTGVITIANDAVTADKIADSINSAITANTAKVTNATHTGEVTGATALTIADNVVDEANLKVSNAPVNGYFLSAQSGDTGGLTWAEVSGGFSFNAVTGATPSLDVGSYNFFDNGTLAANTTVSFASVPTEANWKYTFEVGTGNAWDISTASYTGKSFDGIGSFDWGSLFFKADGRRLFTVDADSKTIDEFILQVPWDIETAIYNISSPTIVGEGSPRGLFIKPDGTSYYAIGPSSDTVIQYNMSRAWDLTSATAGVTYATTQTLQASEIFFKEDGLKMYVLCPYNDAVYQYTLSTEWAVNTASYASKSFSTLSQDTNPHGMFFSSDGTKMYILGLTNDTVYQYTLSTAWDLATASYATKSFSVASEETSPRGMFIKPDGGAMYVIGSVPAAGGDDKIFQYDIGNITLTLPAAIENPPTEPLVLGSRYTYDFFTEDAGTTVTLLSENKE
jgi:hypothetical protein